MLQMNRILIVCEYIANPGCSFMELDYTRKRFRCPWEGKKNHSVGEWEERDTQVR